MRSRETRKNQGNLEAVVKGNSHGGLAGMIYRYISGRTSCRKCSKCFYVYLNIRPVRYSARITAKKCSATGDCCRNPGGDRRPSSTVKYCSATRLLPNRQRGERPGVNGLPFSHRRKETPVFNKLQLLVNRRLRQNRLRGPS